MTDRGVQRSREQIRALVAEQAAAWLMRLEDPGVTPADRAEFADWLKASPAHVYEFLNARAVWDAMSGKALEGLPDQETLLRGVSESEEADVIRLSGASKDAALDLSTHSRRRETRRRRPVFAIAASILALIFAGAAYWILDPFNPAHAAYETEVGEQATHALPDGSTVVLNTRSRVRLDWSEQYRDIYLDEGEALFEVAPNPARPFRVWTGASMVQAVGTRFNVYREADAVTVTVLEGRVEVSDATSETRPGATLAKPVLLAAGEQVRIEPNEVIRAERLAKPERTVDWQARRLVFEGTPLSEVIGEFNRYHEKPLELADDALAAKRINGIFDPTDRDSLVAFLEEFENARIEVQPDAIIVHLR